MLRKSTIEYGIEENPSSQYSECCALYAFKYNKSIFNNFGLQSPRLVIELQDNLRSLDTVGHVAILENPGHKFGGIVIKIPSRLAL